MSRHCPKCERLFTDTLAEFCPDDGEALVTAAAEDAAPEAPPADPAQPAAEPPPASERPSAGERFRAWLDSLRGTTTSATSPLPQTERDKGWSVSGEIEPRAAFDQWPLSNSDGRAGTLTRYRPSALTNARVYERLPSLAGLPGPELFSWGCDSQGGLEVSYEITSPLSGVPLSTWMQSHRGEAAAAEIAAAILDLLDQLRSSGVRALVLEPDVLRVHQGRLSLGLLGVLTEAQSTGYQEFSRCPLVAAPYAAPELIERNRASMTGDVFSGAQIVEAIRSGEPFSYDTLRNGSVAFQSISDRTLAARLQCMVWPHEEGRASLEVLRQGGALPIPEWARLRPGAAENAFSLGGVSFWHAPEVMAETSRHWSEAVARLDSLMEWILSTPFAPHARAIAAQSHKSADWRLVRLIRRIAPDLPPFWRNYSFAEQDLTTTLNQLARCAVDGDPQAVADLEALFAADLTGAFNP